MSLNGIDVSSHQGIIDWDKVKASGQVDFAILRIGFGDDIQSQDDVQFERNYNECLRLGIPFGFYFFTYAMSKENFDSEIRHIKRLLSGKKETTTLPLWIDVENDGSYNWRNLSNQSMLNIFKEYQIALKDFGWNFGIYSSASAFWNEKMFDPWYDTIDKWVALYDSNFWFNRETAIWQNSSSGRIDGINGRVDTNISFKNYLTNTITKIETQPITTTY